MIQPPPAAAAPGPQPVDGMRPTLTDLTEGQSSPAWNRPWLVLAIALLAGMAATATLGIPAGKGDGKCIYPMFDPDVLLHLRRVEQVVESEGKVALTGIDRYSAFPHTYPYPYAPLLDVLCIRAAWLYFALFPDSGTKLFEIVGWVPPVTGGLFSCCGSVGAAAVPPLPC